MKGASNRWLCNLMCGRPGTRTVCGYRLCDYCVVTIRLIATDARVTVDEGMLSGGLRPLKKRQLTKDQRKLEDAIERRAIAKATRSA